MKTGFVTCVELGLSCMQAIYAAGGRLTFAITLPDDYATMKSGRVYLDDFCARHGIELFKNRGINTPESIEFLQRQRADLLFIIGWSQVASPGVLAAAGRVIGMHPTLLPEGRGRAAIPWAIIKGLSETGVTMFQLDTGVDTGDILAQEPLPLADNETATSLYRRVADAHARLLRENWNALVTGTLKARSQDERLASYWPGRTPADGELRITMTVREAHALVRATTRPYPGAFLRLDDERVLRIWSGRPASGAPLPSGAQRIPFSDGEYDAIDCAVEYLRAPRADASKSSSR